MSDSLMDFSERCRLCIEPKRLSIDIFSEEGRRMKLKSKINKNLPLKVSQSDGLPSQICYQCLFRLETWVSFKQLCMERDQVMKTWSQSFVDEASCGIEESFRGRQKNCKIVKTKDSNTSRIPRSRPDSMETVGSNEDFASSNHIDDAKSDTSVWEVVKMDEAENMECESLQADVSQTLVDNLSSADFASDDKVDWTKFKFRKPNKVGTSGSDASMSNDIDSSCIDVLGQSFDGITSTFTSSVPCTSSPHGQEPAPVKRKRGRPSKASLQKERDRKKLKEQEDRHLENVTIPKQEIVSDQNAKPDEEEEAILNEDASANLEVIRNVRPNVVTPDFTTVERDGELGVTEVVLDDPDFGSMKFTLSVVEVGSPTSSPIPTDSCPYYNYASSCGNVSSDSLHREDFEGFESPSSTNFVKPSLQEDILSSLEDVSRPGSQADNSLICSGDISPDGIKRKRSSSASSDFRVTCSTSKNLKLQNSEELLSDNVNIHLCGLSKSLEDISASENTSQFYSDASEERNAYSDGELSESPHKRQGRKSSLCNNC